MKALAYLITAALLLAGCSSAPLADQTLGKAQARSWDRQVKFQDYRFAGETPTGLAGIHAEQIMDVHNQTFAEAPEKAEVFELGIVGGSSGGSN